MVAARMHSFYELNHRRQVLRLRGLAAAALKEYDIRVRRISVLQHYQNTTFLVDGVTDDRAERFVLRIHRPAYHDVAAVASELEWLSAIRRDTQLVVPDPVPTRDAVMLTVVTVPEVPEARICVLFRWIYGQMLRPPRSSQTLESVGRFIGEIHRHADVFRRSPGFARRRWNLQGIHGRAVGLQPGRERGLLSGAEQKLVERALHRTGAAMRDLGEGSDVFGLIHSDLFWRNLLVHHRRLRAIDFDGCGFGYYAYDLAVTLTDERHTTRHAEVRAAVLQGYRSVRRLSEEEEAYLDVFIAARLTVHALWVAANIGAPLSSEKSKRFMSEQMAKLRELV